MLSYRVGMGPSSKFVPFEWERSLTSIAWCFTSEQLGSLSTGTSIIDDVNSPLMAESLALHKGNTEARKLELPAVTFLSDCATLIRAISTPNQLKEIYGVFKDIKSLSTGFDSTVFNHISCSHNAMLIF
ncbi:hypothetical protein DY000_02027031 [Brassica cretica]|uniref:RNase H type-1 domain-containing protein n=1 Tax=Brassica cretica TaxID=69181 RepID=A0ABQ7EG89_BRACR|nr:hypothetical protein DY000_02027031 [Brassica cretica]